MSPENQGVFQLLKEVTFLRIQAFFSSEKRDITGFLSKVSSISFVGSDASYRIFMLSPSFVVAEYALSYQNTARNSGFTFMSRIDETLI